MVNPTRHAMTPPPTPPNRPNLVRDALASLHVGDVLSERKRRRDYDRRERERCQRLLQRHTFWDLLYSDSTATEAWLCLSMLTLAMMQFIPVLHCFNLISQLVAAAPQPLTPLWIGAVGMVRLIAVIFHLHRLRWWMAIAAFFTWITLLYLSFGAHWQGGASLLLLMFAVQSGWVFFRIADDF